jgi:hypothetical protein
MTGSFKLASVIIALLLNLNFGMGPTIAADLPLGNSETRKADGPATRIDIKMRLEEFANGPNATCTAWTDGCRTCGRNPDGVFCSNEGIACQSSEPRCTRP